MGYEGNVLSIVFAILGLVLAVIAQLAGAGRIPPNGFVGIRVPATMRSASAWRAGHRAAAIPAWIGFVLMAGFASVGWFAHRPFAFVVVTVVFVLTIVAAVVTASLAAKRA